MSSSQDTSTDQTSHNAQSFDKKHLAIALGIGLSIVALITMCLLFAIFLHNRNSERRRSHRKPKRTTSQKRLHKLDAELPSCTLEHWWSKAKVPPAPAEGTDGNFVCAICLEAVLPEHEIRDLKCLHVFHKDCLDKWYLQDQFNCPLCHRAYFQQQFQPTNEFVWMV